ncbi:hypothetical protein BU15DRAFT_83023 [Melanogaster broomeanus]|nr:hypothetical protein BU15DRAFT_83023 [Melanogaster broomeanus]
MSSIELTYQQNLDALFPGPSLPPSPLSPQRFPGSSLESLATLHHVSHRALAIYALGESASHIKDYYEQDAKCQRPPLKSPGPITEDNFVEHIGDENFYQGYMTVFSKQIDERGAAETLEQFIFSEKYNFQDGRDATSQPEMLFRLMDGLLHPMIHFGYGMRKSLALCAVGTASERELYPSSPFVAIPTAEVDGTGDLLSSLVFNAKPAAALTISKIGGVHAFDIIVRMLNVDQLKPKAVIRRYTEMWTVDLREAGEIERKMEELIWVSSVTYGVGGFDAEKAFTPDLYLMHLVTSSLFLPSLIAYLSPRSRVSLSHAYLTSVLTWWNPPSRIPSNQRHPTIEGTPIPNPFLPIIQSVLTHPNDHRAKIQRAFAHFNTLYGLRRAGYFAGTELEGAELLDGSLFVRAAVLTAGSLEWVREGPEANIWNMEGVHKQ